MKYSRFFKNLTKRKQNKLEIIPNINNTSYEVIYYNNYLDFAFEFAKLKDSDMKDRFKKISIPRDTQIDMSTYSENGKTEEEDKVLDIIDYLNNFGLIDYLPIFSNIVIKIYTNDSSKLSTDILSLIPAIDYQFKTSSELYVKLSLSCFNHINFKDNTSKFYIDLIIDLIENYTDMKFVNTNIYNNEIDELQMLSYNIPLAKPSIFNSSWIYIESESKSLIYLGIDPVIESEDLLFLRNIYLYIEDKSLMYELNLCLYGKTKCLGIDTLISLPLDIVKLLYIENNTIILDIFNNNIPELNEVIYLFDNEIKEDNEIE